MHKPLDVGGSEIFGSETRTPYVREFVLKSPSWGVPVSEPPTLGSSARTPVVVVAAVAGVVIDS